MSTKKMTKTERVQQKIAEGMSHIDAEVAVAQELHREEMATLKARAQREQKRIDALIPGIIQERWPDVYEQAAAEARERHEQARARRASARRGTATRSAEPAPAHEQQDEASRDHSYMHAPQ